MAYTYDPIFAQDPNNPNVVASNATITIYNPADATKAPIAITDASGSPLPNPIKVDGRGMGPAFQHPTLDRVAWTGGGFQNFFTSYEGMKNEASAAKQAAQSAADTATAAAAEVVTAAAVNGSGKLILTKANGAIQDAGSVIGPKGDKGDKGVDGANVLPTDDAIEQAILGSGTKTKAALSATYATSESVRKRAEFGRSQVYNNTGSSLRKFRAAQARSEAGGNPVNVLLKADSIGQSTVNAPFSKNSWFARVQAMVEARSGYYGSGMNFLFDVGGQDTRWSQTGTWARLAGKGMVEAQAYTTVTAGSTATFTDDFDRITVYYLTTADGGTDAKYALNGGAATTFSANGAESVQSFTVTATRGTNSLVITAPTAGRLTLLAVDVRVGTTKGYRFQKAAVAGQTVGNFTRNDAPGAPLALSASLAVPDLTIIALETNDYANWATPLATYRAGLVSLISSAQTTGDVVLIATPTPERRRGTDGIGGNANDIPLTTSPTLADYTATLYELADTYNCVVLDFQERWGDFAAANVAGLMADDYHPSDRGNWDYAHALYEAIFQYGTTAEVLTDNKRVWKAPQTFGDPANGAQGRFMVGSFEMNGSVFPAHPYYLATAGGNVYTAAPGSGKFIMLRSDMMVSAGTKWKGENANLPAGDFDSFIRLKRYTTAGRIAAATAGAGAVCIDSDLNKIIQSDGTNWRDAMGTVV